MENSTKSKFFKTEYCAKKCLIKLNKHSASVITKVVKKISLPLNINMDGKVTVHVNNYHMKEHDLKTTHIRVYF